jgi:succinate dehydrogenase hydrophobic anchor subunit
MTFPELDSTFTRILSMLLTGAIVVSPFALAYVLWTYFHSDKPRPMLYTALVVALYIITVAGIYLGRSRSGRCPSSPRSPDSRCWCRSS